MTSPSTQFAPLRRMGIYDPFHHTSMWEDMYKGAISQNTGVSIVTQADAILVDKPDYTSHEALGTSENNQAVKSLSDKIQRRLAQNRDAARKSRLRKKAYVQQLETSRLKLAQLEQELERARQQGAYIGSAFDTIYTGLSGTFTSGIAAFEMEYAHWVEELLKKNCELRSVLQGHIGDIELQILVQSVLNHYDYLFRMKAEVAKVDVSYLISGAWKTSVERLFLWIGGFRPSELLSVLISHLHPLTEEQVVSVGNLRRSCQQAEDALSQGMEKLQEILVQSVTTDTFGTGSYRSQMAAAVEKLEALESFASQADHLRQQTLTQMSRILTMHQAACGLVALGEYFERLRSLSILWAGRTRETA